MKRTEEKKIHRRMLELLGIGIKQHSTSEEFDTDIRKIQRDSNVGIFLIMLIQILQEFVSIVYLNHVLVSIGIVEMILFLVGSMLYFMRLCRERNGEFDNWKNIEAFHNNFILSILIPMIFFFPADIISFAGTRIKNVTLMKELAVFIAFLSILIYKGIGKWVEKQGNKNETLYIKVRWMMMGAWIPDFSLLLMIYFLLLGMMIRDERLAVLIWTIGVLLGLLLIIPIIYEDKKKILQAAVAIFLVTGSSFLLYEQYLTKMDNSYYIEPSVYYGTGYYYGEDRMDIYCQFTDEGDTELLTYYFLHLDQSGDIADYASAEYHFIPYKWKEGIWVWYDSDFRKLSKKDAGEGSQPIEIYITDEKIQYSQDFPENYKEIASGDECRYTRLEERDTDLFIQKNDNTGWFRGFQLQRIEKIPDEILLLK